MYTIFVCSVVRVGGVAVVVGGVSGAERGRRARLQEEDHLPPAARRQAWLRRPRQALTQLVSSHAKRIKNLRECLIR